MESPLSAFFRMHWDHEPDRPPARPRPRRQALESRTRTTTRTRRRFMESPLGPTALHRDHEPRNRGAGRKAPINRTHSKRFAPAESLDRATAFGVRASSAPLSKACCDSVDGAHALIKTMNFLVARSPGFSRYGPRA